MNLKPYLSFNGNCADAFKFYEGVFGSKISFVMTYGEAPPGNPVPPGMADRVMHVSMPVGDTVLMGADAPAQFASTPAGFSITIDAGTPKEAEEVYAALSEGGTIRMPIGETFWARRFAMLVDKFGIPWMINCGKPMDQ